MAPRVIRCPYCRRPVSEHVRADEAAHYLDCTDRNVRYLLAVGRLAGFQVGRGWHICPAELRRFVRDHHNLLGKEIG